MKKQLITGLAFCLSLMGHAQSISINREWQDTTGNPFINPLMNPAGLDWTASVTDGSGNIYTVGHTNVSGQGENLYLSKHLATGGLVFETNVNTTGTNNDYGTAIALDGSGNIWVCGTTDNGGVTNYDGLLMQFNSSGVLQLNIPYSGSAGMNDISTNLCIDPSGDVLVICAGESLLSLSDYHLLKYSGTGSLLYDVYYDFANLIDVPLALDVNTGTVVVSGASANSFTDWDYALAYFDLNTGAYISDTRTNLPGVGMNQPYAFKKDAAQNIYLTGKGSTNGTDYDLFTVKVNSNFTIAWTATLDAAGGEDVGSAIDVDASGNVFVGGYITNTNNVKELIAIKYNSTGSLVWQYRQPAEDVTGDAYIKSLCVKSNNNIYFAAGERGLSGFQQVRAGRISPAGTPRWQKVIASTDDVTPIQLLRGIGKTFHVFSMIGGLSPSYQTTTLSEFESDTARKFNSAGKSVYKNKELITAFWPNRVDIAAIDNLAGTKIMHHGTLEQFLTPSAFNSVDSAINLVCHNCEIYVTRVYNDLTTTQNSFVSLLGDSISIPELWATFVLHLPPALSMDQAYAVFRSLPGIIAYSEPNYVIKSLSVPNDSLYYLQKSLACTPPDVIADINMEEAWDIVPNGGVTSVECGVFDTGVDWKHPEFGYSYPLSYGKVDGYDFDCGGDMHQLAVADSGGHGTAVAGIIAAQRNNSWGISGIVGGNSLMSSEGVKIKSADVVGQTVDLAADLIFKTAYTAQTYQFFVQISNNSWGFDSINHPFSATDTLLSALTEAMRTAYQKQVTFVAARGNSNSDIWEGPACLDSNWVISVSATGSDGEFKNDIFEETDWGSSYGRGVDVGAPGVLSMCMTTGPSYAYNFAPFRMTSCATPHVTGVAALLMSYMKPLQLAPEDNEFIIKNSATNIGPPGRWDKYSGYGRLNAGKALRMVEKPYRSLYHYATNSTPHTLNVSVYSNSDTVRITERYKSYETPGKWYAKGKYVVKTFQVDATVNHSLGFITDSIIYGWPRHSSSYGLPLFNNLNQTNLHELVKLNSCTPSAANLTCFVYKVWDTSGNFLGWWPCDTSFAGLQNKSLFAYSVLVKNKAVGIEENNGESKPSVALFPNPASQQQTLVIESAKACECTIELYDLMGRHLKTVYKGKISSGQTQVTNSIEKLPESMYIYMIRLGDEKIVKKFIKQ